MSDPFAPPKSSQRLDRPSGRVFRAGDVLVVPLGRPEWPDRCVRCGEASVGRASEMFGDSPWITWFLAIVAGIVVGQLTQWVPLALVSMALVIWIPSTVRVLPVPACGRHRRGIVVGRALHLLSVALFGAVGLPIGEYPKLVLLCLALAGIVVAVVLGSRLTTLTIEDGYVQVRGAHADLLRLVPDVEAGLPR